MKNFKISLALMILLMTLAAFAEEVAVFPLTAEKESDARAAKDIDESIEDVFGDFNGVDAVSAADILNKKGVREASKCAGDLNCQKKLAEKSKKKADFYIFTKMKIVKKTGKTIVDTYLFDGSLSGLEKKNIKFDGGDSSDDIAEGLVKAWNKMIKPHLGAEEPEEEEEEAPKPVKKPEKKVSKNVTAAIVAALEAYADGDLKAAEKSLADVASDDVTAKELLNDITFSCAMRSHIKEIALRMTAEDCVWMNGSCDNKVYSVVPRNEDDLLRIRQMMAGMGAHKSTLDLLSAEHIGKVLLIVTGYDDDWAAFQTLEGLVKDATDGKYELKKKEEE